MANTVMNPPPRLREIVLLDNWNEPVPPEELWSEEQDKCKTCGWNGRAELLLEHNLADVVNHPAASLRRSAEDGCVSCQIVEAVLNALGITSRLAYISARGGGLCIEYLAKMGTASRSVDVFVQEWEPALEPPLGFPRRRLLGSSVESSIDWAKQQLAACVLSHPSCRVGSSTSSSGSFLPTRLINLSPLERNADIFLEDRDTIQPGSLYAALSYTWGTGQLPACVTTAQTLKAHQQGIPWGAVPATFRDVIYVARQLGVSYLWIDSICIVQGDKEEWEREGGTMFHVYQNAHVTLAAAAGRGGFTGLWKDPSGHRQATLAARLRLRDVLWPLYIRPRHDEFYDWRKLRFPLFSRAWAYQERLVSPRLLLFMGSEVAYQCFQACDCECGLDAVPPFTSVYKSVVGDKQVFSDRFGGVQGGPQPLGRTDEPSAADEEEGGDYPTFRNRAHQDGSAWRQMVHDYRTMRLSNEGDRLMAIGAIAEHVQASRAGEVYLAGLWSGSLHADLLWGNGWPRSRAWSRTKSQPSSPVAPSWSWASRPPLPSDSFSVMSEKIAKAMAYGQKLAEVLDAPCPHTKDNPFGKAPSGELVLRGRLLACRFLACRFLGLTGGMILLCDGQAMYLDYMSVYENIQHDKALWYASFGQFYLLELGSANSTISLYSRPYRLYLMLKRKGRGEKTYVRIGIAQLPECKGSPKPFVELGSVEVCTLV